MKHSIELGIRGKSLEEVGGVASEYFGLPLSEQYSDYMGGDYYRINGRDEEVRIQRNRDCENVAEEDHPDVDVLVLVDPTTRPDEIRTFFFANFDCVLVRQEAYPMK